ncbi:MAG: 4Fe-4S dicluster domain-containing protein, partial [Alphaproteobacteria bacterium]|nr:4Fe-4S dicluster domain-containing protein [Alphaproteobacteria bacterium]
MQTRLSQSQLAHPALAEANEVLRTCVHCGLCLATCPTYAILGDERDSPRGRIYLIKDMLEADGPADATVTRHIDRCLSCLSCMTTCPAGVDYMHLVDHARGHIEKTWVRPLPERLLRTLLALALPRPGLARLALLAARGPALLAPLFGGRLGALLRLAGRPAHGPSWIERPQVIPARGPRRARVALLTGCVQCVLAPEIIEAAVRVLTRHGCVVVVPRG